MSSIIQKKSWISLLNCTLCWQGLMWTINLCGIRRLGGTSQIERRNENPEAEGYTERCFRIWMHLRILPELMCLTGWWEYRVSFGMPGMMGRLESPSLMISLSNLQQGPTGKWKNGSLALGWSCVTVIAAFGTAACNETADIPAGSYGLPTEHANFLFKHPGQSNVPAI